MAQKVQLVYEGKTYEYPIVEGSENEKAIDISKLRDQTGLITMDVGFKNTGSTFSKITFLDGELGILRYRGYEIDELAEKASFMEVSYLLIFGELPTQTQLNDFEAQIKAHSMPPADLIKIFDHIPSNAHPMGIVAALVSALTAFYPKSWDPQVEKDEIMPTIYRLMGMLPVLAAMCYKNSQKQPIIMPDSRYDYCSNFLHMMFATPDTDYKPDPIVANALDKLLILHADHEQNCSTSTVRTVGSSQASLYSCISAGIDALWGKSHGGANQEVIEMLEEIRADNGNIAKYVEMAKDKNSAFRLMGFGHRVYKNFDPRAKIIKRAADNVLAKLGVSDPTLDIAKQLEEIALKDDYFVSRKLFPNVDFYSGIIYRALGIPVDMFTVMFAIGRLPGWIAQWKEMVEQKQAIVRPRQIYTGAKPRAFVPMTERK